MRWILPVALVVAGAALYFVLSASRPNPSSSGAEPVVPPPSASPTAAPRAPVVAEDGWRALTTAVDAGRPLRLLLRRTHEDTWGFVQPSSSPEPTFHFALHEGDSSLTLPAGTIDREPVTLRSGNDGVVLMKFRADAGAPAATVVLTDNVPWDPTSHATDHGFDVHIGKHVARAQIHRDGTNLYGFYRYPSSHEDLELSGKVQPDGRFTLVERTKTCFVSGRWEGLFLSPSLAAGEWNSAGGKKQVTLTFWMMGGVDLARSSPDGLTVEAKNEEQNDAGAGCTNTLQSVRVSGLVPAARNGAVNKAIDELSKGWQSVFCDGTEPNLPYSSETEITDQGQVPGFLSLSIFGSANLGGAHPMHGGSCALIDTNTGAAVSLGTILGPAMGKLIEQVGDKLRDYWKENALGGDPPTELADEKLCYGGPDLFQVRFSPYEVAPYMFGSVTIDVDVEPLLSLVPKSPAKDALFGETGRKPDASVSHCPPLD
jgi:hypothetical protein